jgi:hypothetical protein
MVLGAHGASLGPEVDYLVVPDRSACAGVLAATNSHSAVPRMAECHVFKPGSWFPSARREKKMKNR